MYSVCSFYALSLCFLSLYALVVHYAHDCSYINMYNIWCIYSSILCPQAWAYMLGGLIIYAIERIVRFFRSLRKVVIVKVVEHPSKTIEIQMRSKGFYADAGQYVFVNVPSVALFEWHPFTLTSVSPTLYNHTHDARTCTCAYTNVDSKYSG